MPRAGLEQAFTTLADDLKVIAGDRPLLFLMNPGNWGDALIREGTEQFLQQHGFRYARAKAMDLRKGRISLADAKALTGHPEPVMLFNGCGIYYSAYNWIPALAQMSHQFESAVFLPATYPEPLAKAGFAENAVFYARDRFESLHNMPNARFCHDMALFLRPDAPAPRRDTGYFLRKDKEMPPQVQIPRGNQDISRKGRTPSPIDGFVARIGQYRHVVTNRLHVGICAALLGRQVTLLPNNYFKIRAIYQSSLQPYFPNVTFCEDYAQMPQPAARRWW